MAKFKKINLDLCIALPSASDILIIESLMRIKLFDKESAMVLDGRKILVLLSILLTSNLWAITNQTIDGISYNSDLIIFTYNRPMQLYALLESIEKNLTGIASTTIICRADNERYQRAYNLVGQRFSNVRFLFQGSDPVKDFKQLTMKALHDGSQAYVCFAVDDIIVKKEADMAYCARILGISQAYGFYLRMGKHLNYCYPVASAQGLPPLRDMPNDLVAWVFGTGTFDWRYPNTVDMTIYRKADVWPTLESFAFAHPNELEGRWATMAGNLDDRVGICFAESIIVNIPLNIVNASGNRNMDSFSTDALLDLFEQGYKIDINQLYKIKNSSCHIEFNMTLVQR